MSSGCCNSTDRVGHARDGGEGGVGGARLLPSAHRSYCWSYISLQHNHWICRTWLPSFQMVSRWWDFETWWEASQRQWISSEIQIRRLGGADGRLHRVTDTAVFLERSAEASTGGRAGGVRHCPVPCLQSGHRADSNRFQPRSTNFLIQIASNPDMTIKFLCTFYNFYNSNCFQPRYDDKILMYRLTINYKTKRNQTKIRSEHQRSCHKYTVLRTQRAIAPLVSSTPDAISVVPSIPWKRSIFFRNVENLCLVHVLSLFCQTVL